MKIEKVNDNQIRCTLTREDLAVRNLKISELAYGTEKAKTLFREMMQQANNEFGFEADNIPLMIEAIPLNAECLVLLITKVEEPEELDTRFSKFAPILQEEEDLDDFETDDSDEIRDLFRRVSDGQENSSPATATLATPDTQPCTCLFRIFRMNQAIDACKLIVLSYSGDSALYRKKKTGEYFLLLDGQTQYALGEQQLEFGKICNTLTEYGTPVRGEFLPQSLSSAVYETLIPSGAVEALGTI